MSYTVDWAIGRAYLHAKGKATVPAAGTSKYNALLAIADSCQKLWASESDVEWNSLYKLAPLAQAVTTTDTYALPSDVQALSQSAEDPVRITDGTQFYDYEMVRPNQLWRYRDEHVCAQEGSNLKFPKAFDAADPMIGMQIMVPYIQTVPDITAGSNTIVVDDPMWLVYMMAAEFDRNDIVKMGQYGNLVQLASTCMDKMKDDNDGQLGELQTDWQPEGLTWR